MKNLENLRSFKITYIGPSNRSGAKVKIHDLRYNESKNIPRGSESDSDKLAYDFLTSLGIKIIFKSWHEVKSHQYIIYLTKNFDKRIK